jgi:hypothetical protein
MSDQFRVWVAHLVRIYKQDIGIYKLSKGDGAGINRTLPEGVNIKFYKTKDTAIYNIYQIHQFNDCSFLCLMVFKIDNNNIDPHVHIELTYLPGKLESNYRPIGNKSTDWIETRNKHINSNGRNNTAGIFYRGPTNTEFLIGGPNIYVKIKYLLLSAVNIPLNIPLKNLITPTYAFSKYVYALHVRIVYAGINKFADDFGNNQIMVNRTPMNIPQALQALQAISKDSTRLAEFNKTQFAFFSKTSIIYDFIFVYALIFPYDPKWKLDNWLKWVMNLIDDYKSTTSKCTLLNSIATDYVRRYSKPFGTYPRKNPPVNEPLDAMYNASMNKLTEIKVDLLHLYNRPIDIDFINNML